MISEGVKELIVELALCLERFLETVRSELTTRFYALYNGDICLVEKFGFVFSSLENA